MTKTSGSICPGGHIARRAFLRVGSLPFLGITLQQYLGLKQLFASPLAQNPGKAQACILLWLAGGPSHVDTWDPKPNSSFRPIATNVPGIQVSELLPEVARRMDRLSIIRSMHTEEIDHPESTHYFITGHRPNPAMKFPSLGAILSKETGSRNGVPPHVMVPSIVKVYDDYFKAAYLGAKYDPLVVPDPSQKGFEIPDLQLPETITVERIEDRRGFARIIDAMFRERERMAEFARLDGLTEEALKMILSPAIKDAFDLSKESQKTRDAYGRDGFGQSVLLARRLVQKGARFVTACGFKHSSWDTHANSDRDHRDKLVPVLDRTLSTLLDDLQQCGLYESTVVIVTGEFGRTPNINPNNGRDHWPHCWSLALGGGGIQGGQVIGASDEKGAYVADRMITAGDLFATVYKAFGIDWTKTYDTPIGRPVKIANSIGDKTGQPISELI